MRSIALVLAAAIGLAGCASKPIEQMGYAERRELAGKILDRCVALGLKPNTPEMSQCLEAEVQKEATTRQANTIARQNYGRALQQSSQNYQQSMQSRRMNCTHTPGYGGSVTTSCY